MAAVVGIQNKRYFISELVGNFSFKNTNSSFLLSYISRNFKSILPYVHFVDDISGYDRSIIIATAGSKEESFIFYNHGKESRSVQVAYDFLSNNKGTEIYIKIAAEDSLHTFISYQNVLEHNPNAPISKNSKVKTEIDNFLDKIFKDIEIKRIKTEIDTALDEKDKEAFMKYSNKLKQLME